MCWPTQAEGDLIFLCDQITPERLGCFVSRGLLGVPGSKPGGSGYARLPERLRGNGGVGLRDDGVDRLPFDDGMLQQLQLPVVAAARAPRRCTLRRSDRRGEPRSPASLLRDE